LQQRNPNTKFVNNRVLQLLSENTSIEDAVDRRKVNNWSLNDDYILLLLDVIKQSDLYQNYMLEKESSFELDKRFVVDVFTQIIACNDKLYDYLEDSKLSWVDDIPVVNTTIQKQLKQISDDPEYLFTVPRVYRDSEDKDFGLQLFRRTVLNEEALAQEYIQRTPNWDPERIAEVDTIMLKMAICEFTKFPSIPVKVTINEYLEIAKEYSTPKSSIFINGILDGFVKEFQDTEKIRKSGRGLM
jgi:N utilization substance protein B